MRIQIRDPDLFDPGSGMEKLGSGINHPGSATLKSTFFFIREGQEVAVQQVGEGGQKPGPAQPLQAVHNGEIKLSKAAISVSNLDTGTHFTKNV
jgi:hypothetical protein